MQYTFALHRISSTQEGVILGVSFKHLVQPSECIQADFLYRQQRQASCANVAGVSKFSILWHSLDGCCWCVSNMCIEATASNCVYAIA